MDVGEFFVDKPLFLTDNLFLPLFSLDGLGILLIFVGMEWRMPAVPAL